ncbi:MAG: tRNA lysidine(34) synthetase TilS [Actinobacteria bacterium]|nr:tRNA lysidine(34) synthetase TilS [Actinomycetota bacterium]
MRRPPAVARVLEQVTATIREHDMFRPGDLVLVSVSGGPDSVCLLYALWYLRRLFRIRLAVFHFDHRLRPDSGDDAEYVRRLCVRLKVPFHLVEAASSPRRGQSVEAWAHLERKRASAAVGNELGSSVRAIAHTLDDQAETVLMAVITGSGLDAVAGLRPAGGREVRPLLGVTRSQVEAFCRALRLRPRRDPTNRDPDLLRNAIRLKGIPALERATGRSLREPIARTGSNLREDAVELSRQAEEYAGRWLPRASASGDARLPARELSALPRAVAARVVRRALAPSGRSSSPEIEAVLDLASGRPGRRLDLSGGLKAWRDREYVHVSYPDRTPTHGER